MSFFVLSIVTPDGNKSLSVRSITGDTQNGRFVVLAGHEASIFALKNGLVSFILEDETKKRFFVEGAVLRIQAMVYVLTAERIAELSMEFLKNYHDTELANRIMKQMED